jgi:isoleucyl-tRNA synthetase
LKRLSLLISPFVPFIAEEIWQKVKSGSDPISVHLALYPESKTDLINLKLEEDMIIVRRIVEMGHSLRSKHLLKVRQPIASIWFNANFICDQTKLTKVILEELNALDFVEKDAMHAPDVIESGKIVVAIETEISDELKEKGDLREVIRSIQKLRKESGLKPSDAAKVEYNSNSDTVNKFIENNSEAIKSSTGTESLIISGEDFKSEFVTVKISTGELNIAIK